MTATASPGGEGQAARVLFRLPVSLRWRDLDAFNHVNNATFLTYLEEARIRWFHSLGGPWLSEDVAPLLASVHIDYRRPIEYPAEVAVELLDDRVGTSSLTIGHRVTGGADGALHADGHVVLVWIDRRTGRPTALPDCVREAAAN